MEVPSFRQNVPQAPRSTIAASIDPQSKSTLIIKFFDVVAMSMRAAERGSNNSFGMWGRLRCDTRQTLDFSWKSGQPVPFSVDGHDQIVFAASGRQFATQPHHVCIDRAIGDLHRIAVDGLQDRIAR